MEKLKGLDLEGKLVLDAGTGACNMTLFLEEWGARVVSIDYRRERQLDCKKKTKYAQFVTSDLRYLDFIEDQAFDHVICNFLISALSEKKDLLISMVFRQFHRILKKDGMLVIIDYYPFEEDSCPSHCHDLQVELWRLENAVSELLGEGHLEEYPPESLEMELQALGFCETEISILLKKVPWPNDLLREHEEMIKEDIQKVEDSYLRRSLQRKLKDVMQKTKGKRVESGAIYELRAKK